MIYEDATRAVVTSFVERFPGEIIVANGDLPAFGKWRAELKREAETLMSDETVTAIRLKSLE